MSLRKNLDDKHPCYTRREDIPCLRVSLSNGEVFLFPYIHLQFAHLVRDSGENVLRITFTTHEVTAHGENLREILEVLQLFALESLGEHFSPQSTSRCKVTSLRVEPVDEVLVDEKN